MKTRMPKSTLAALLAIVFTAGLEAQDCLEIYCPADLVVECEGSDGAHVRFTATATNHCSTNLIPTVTCTPPPGSLFPLGITTVTCTATDVTGNTVRCSFTITVTDAPPFFISCPGNLLAWALDADSTDVAFTAPQATNLLGELVPVTCEPPSGSPFPVGDTEVVCIASNACGGTAECRFTITVRKFKRVQPQMESGQVYGPFVLSARELRNLGGGTLPPLEIEDDFEVGEALPCTNAALCAGDALLHAEPVLTEAGRTPLPTTSWQAKVGVSDPQIASSRTHLVIPLYNRIYFYDKSGKLVTTDKNGFPITNPISTMEFFSPIVPFMNSILNLPPGFSSETYGISRIYDTRIVFDEYRSRFWMISLAWNGDGVKGNTNMIGDYQIRWARRSFFVLAVSSTEDPRDDWYLYLWNNTINDGSCAPDPDCPHERGADYPAVGISEKYLLVGMPWGWAERRYNEVRVAEADALAFPGTNTIFPNWLYWDLQYDDGTPDNSRGGNITPAVHHGSSPWSYLVSTYNQGLAIWALTGPSPPTFYAGFVPLKSYSGPSEAQQPPSPPGIQTPYPLKIANVGNLPLNACYRNGRLTAVWEDCKVWPGEDTCVTSIRLAQVGVLGPGVSASAIKDRTFGRNNIYDDQPDDLVSYGTPAVEMNKDNNLAVIYMRSGATVFPEARFSTWHWGESDIRPSRALKKGEFTFGPDNSAMTNKAIGNLDVSGICVDPFDDTGIWMTHGYAVEKNSAKGGWNLAVGKVFGGAYVDWCVTGFKVASGNFQSGSELTLTGRITNGGDGNAPQTKVAFRLHHSNVSLALGEISLAALASGQSQDFSFTVIVPTNTLPCDFAAQVEVDSAHTTVEYSEANNLAEAYPPLHLLPAVIGRDLSITVISGNPCDYVVQASPDLIKWIPVSTQQVVNGSFEFREPISTTQQRFYRVARVLDGE